MGNQQSIYYLAVGHISDAARVEIERTGGQVMQLHSEPTPVLVGIVKAISP